MRETAMERLGTALVGIRRFAQEADERPDVGWERILADELADTIQAAVNLAAAHGITPEEMDAAMERCRERNRERGRC